MTPTQTRFRKPKTKTRPAPLSLRVAPETVEIINEAALAAGHSTNAFIIESVVGIIEMINAPEGKLVEPRIVALARFLKRHKPQPVSHRE